MRSESSKFARFLKTCRKPVVIFIRSIAVTTGTFTRLAYAIDLRTFFTFLQRERVAFADTPLTYLTDQQIGSVTQSDLTAYIEYLTYYFKEQDADEETAPAEAAGQSRTGD